MPLNSANTKQLLQSFDFRKLFINELGWNNPPHALKPADAEAKGGIRFHRAPVAVLSGIHVFEITTPGGTIPEANDRTDIHAATTKLAAENILIFTDKARTQSLWYWVKREAGKSHRRPHLYVKGQPGELFISKLDALRVEISELDAQGNLAPGEGNRRVRRALDVERVTKKFYDQFTKEHAAFLKSFAACIPVKGDAEWYASVMLNRLMFVYFIQHKGFLDNDRDYLRTRLNLTRSEHGKDQFHFFYRRFLIKLFHEGLGGKKRTTELEKLIGRIPYLNGGMFDVHELEKKYDTGIEIPDAAFERIFDYFDKYDWVLDPEHTVRQPGDKEEINPDVLGYIFEKYINQKQMGAYYTKEDITEYIGKNTIIPFLFDAAKQACSVAFESSFGVPPSGGSAANSPAPDRLKAELPTSLPTVWDLLAKNPDRYIYDAVKKGVQLPLPKEIEVGVNDVSKRDLWNKSAKEEFALPTEIWREVVARRTRYEEIRKKLAAGEVCDINGLITLNLNIRRFALDVIENCEGPDLLRAFWHAITTITVLDPTCGSGAFIFAALNILEPLYEACLDRMAEFLNDEAVKHDATKLKFTKHGYPLLPGGKFEDFAHTLEHVAEHVSPKYFIYKSIILQNLFGVDIMPEAVEICKLRLFLKLAAQVEPDAKKENLGIEPLPDIDFNICAGNTLVGYATLAEVQNSMFGRNYLERIQKADEQIRRFRQRQSQTGDLAEQREDKQQIRALLDEIREKLDMSLFTDYGARELTAWKKSHQPFHWYVEFNSIIQSGGFDVIIGNPPYVEQGATRGAYSIHNYSTKECGNLYAYCVERCIKIARQNGRWSMIIPLSAFETARMLPLQDLIQENSCSLHISFFSGDANPSKLFDGVKFRLAIAVATNRKGVRSCNSTKYNRWYSAARNELFPTLQFCNSATALIKTSTPKIGLQVEIALLEKISRQRPMRTYSGLGKHSLYYHNCPVNWIRSTTFVPKFKSEREGESISTQLRALTFNDLSIRDAANCVINSTVFFWFWLIYSDCYHLTEREIGGFPIDLEALVKQFGKELSEISERLMEDYKANSKRRVYIYKMTGKVVYDEFYPKLSKPILDEIDRLLARHYGFTAAELDFILNYDIKYRLGRATENEED